MDRKRDFESALELSGRTRDEAEEIHTRFYTLLLQMREQNPEPGVVKISIHAGIAAGIMGITTADLWAGVCSGDLITEDDETYGHYAAKLP